MVPRQYSSSEENEDVIQFQPVIESHFETIKRFKDHEKAMGANDDLVFLEEHNPDAYEKALTYIRGLKDGTPIKSKDDRRKKTMPFSGPDRRKKVAG
jgi:hypothetical protein